MNKKSYNNIIQNYKQIILEETTIAPQVDKEVPQQSSSSSSFDSITKSILPILLGLGSTSMLFGQGLFGIGRHNKYFGGWLGQSIGGLGALTLLPSLWSDKDLGQRLKTTLQHVKQGDLLKALLTFFGISVQADKTLKKGKEQATSVQKQKASIEQRRKKYIENSQSVAKIRQWLTNNQYKIDNNIQLTENISCFGLIPQTELEINAVGQKKVVCLIVKSDKGFQATLNKPTQLVPLINNGYANSIKIALTAGKGNKNDFTKNPYRHEDDRENIQNLNRILNKSSDSKIWLDSLLGISNKLKQATKNNITICNNLFDGLSNANGYVLDIPANLNNLTTEQTQSSAQQIASDFVNDQSLKDIKDDPILNKFDKGIKASQNKIENIYINTIIDALNTANQKDPTAFIIQCIDGSKTLYYARKPQQNYLTDKLEETIYFSKQQVQKLEGSGDLISKLEKTLEKIHLPQIMKIKNPGLKVIIKGFNIEFTNKFQEFTEKYKINLN